MLKIESNYIKLTRGDTARFSVDVTNVITDDYYDIAPDDTLTFTVKRTTNDKTFILQKTVVGDNQFYIKPEDTADLSYGKYKYDVQLSTAGGDVYTIIEPSKFEISQEVTF